MPNRRGSPLGGVHSNAWREPTGLWNRLFDMSEAVETLLLICRCLKLDRSDSAVSRFQQDLSERSDRWPAIIDLANPHYLTPALWAALEEKGLTECLPADAQDFLREAHRLNRARNIGIKEQAEDPPAAGPRDRGRNGLFRRRFGSGRDRIRTSVWRTSGPADPRDRAIFWRSSIWKPGCVAIATSP